MTRYCNNCGTVIPDGSDVCTTCGAPAPIEDKPKKSKGSLGLILGIVGGIVVLAGLAILVYFLLFSSSNTPESAVAGTMKAMFDTRDAKQMTVYMHEDVVKAEADSMDLSVAEFNDAFQEQLDIMYEGFDESADEWEVQWEVLDAVDAKSSKANEIIESYEEDYGLEVEEVKMVPVLITVSLTESGVADDYDNKADVPAIKIDGKWYMDPDNMGDLV